MNLKNQQTNINNTKITNLIILIFCLLPILVSFSMKTNGTIVKISIFGLNPDYNTFCIFKFFTHYNCPTCGMTRCFIYMSHFDLSKALVMKLSGVLLYLFFIFQIFLRIFLVIFNISEPKLLKTQIFIIILILCLILVEFILQFV